MTRVLSSRIPSLLGLRAKTGRSANETAAVQQWVSVTLKREHNSQSLFLSLINVPGLRSETCGRCERSYRGIGPPNSSQQPTRGRTLARRFRASRFVGWGVSLAGT